MKTLVAIVIVVYLLQRYIIITREPVVVRCDGGEPGA